MVDGASYRCGEVQIDAVNRRFLRADVEVALEPKTFAVVLQLLIRPGALVTRNELLDAVWGHRYVTPSTLNRVIALARRAFGDDTEVPRFIQTVHGAGYRYIGPIERAAASVAEPAAKFAPPPVARLPARFEPLIGRDAELASLGELLQAHRAVSVIGPGGIGKTQCALEAARRAAALFEDGVWFFDLAPMTEGDDWLRALAAALAIAPAGRSELVARVLRLLRGRHALILVDNCDRIAADIGILAVELLLGSDRLSILATSQAPLRFRGEQIMRLPPLALPESAAGDRPAIEEIARAPAVQMLVARVRGAQPGFVLTAANAASVADICRRLDGMPLALELAAARFALLSAEQVLMRLDQRFRFLSSDEAGRDLRHRNLLALLDWSYSLLSGEEQRLLMWCSVFVQGWTVDAALDLADALGREPEVIVDLLAGLVNKSLVVADSRLAPPRYYLLETVREYALERLRAAGEDGSARNAHLALMERMAQSAHRKMIDGRMPEGIGQFAHEDGNLFAALEHALSQEATRRAALSVLGSLALYMKARGVYHLFERWCRRALTGTEALESRERSRALLTHGLACVHLMPAERMPGELLLESLRLARLHEDHWTQAYASGFYALWLVNGGRSDEARGHIEAVERIAMQLEDSSLQGLAGLLRGWVLIAHAEHAAARAELQRVRSFGQDVHQRHFIDIYIGLASFGQRNFAAAAGQWGDALRNAVAVGNTRGMAGSIEGCAYIACQRGDWPEAARYLRVAERIRERTEVPLFNFWVPLNQAAHESLRTRLGAHAYEAALRAADRLREEDTVNEVSARLQHYAEPTAAAPIA